MVEMSGNGEIAENVGAPTFQVMVQFLFCRALAVKTLSGEYNAIVEADLLDEVRATGRNCRLADIASNSLGFVGAWQLLKDVLR
jgi:hypothetical protein